MVLALALAAAAPLPRLTLFTALPLLWGEGDPADILNGQTGRSPLLDGLDVRGIDVVSAQTLSSDVLVVAQPRAMAPEELVALDGWVRGGGRAIIFADPLLKWPSRFPLGDRRRAPPVTLLDPLLTHWGVTLEAGTDGIGRWRPGPCAPLDSVTIECPIGRGRALLVADADELDARVSDGSHFRALLTAVAENRGATRDSGPWRWVAAGTAAALILAFLWFRRRRYRT